jgi:malonyl-CoA O-methyltransferase
MDMETITVTYDTPQALLADVRAFGGNPLATRRRGLVGRAAWQRVLAALEEATAPGRQAGPDLRGHLRPRLPTGAQGDGLW